MPGFGKINSGIEFHFCPVHMSQLFFKCRFGNIHLYLVSFQIGKDKACLRLLNFILSSHGVCLRQGQFRTSYLHLSHRPFEFQRDDVNFILDNIKAGLFHFELDRCPVNIHQKGLDFCLDSRYL